MNLLSIDLILIKVYLLLMNILVLLTLKAYQSNYYNINLIILNSWAYSLIKLMLSYIMIQF
jgi:hypothetical protein